MFEGITSAGATKVRAQLLSTERKVHVLLTQLENAELSASSSSSVAAGSLSTSKLEASMPSDWTNAYQKWNKWDHVESLHEQVAVESEKVDSLSNKLSTSLHSHAHDHSEERKLFEMDESKKKSYCERHRAKGNYLFYEGLYPKAAEQYQLALSYYEYCFPGTSSANEFSVRTLSLTPART